MYEQAYTQLQRMRDSTNGPPPSRISLEGDGMFNVHDLPGLASEITRQLRLVTESRARKSNAAKQVELNVTWMVENMSAEVIVAAARDLSVELDGAYLVATTRWTRSICSTPKRSTASGPSPIGRLLTSCLHEPQSSSSTTPWRTKVCAATISCKASKRIDMRTTHSATRTLKPPIESDFAPRSRRSLMTAGHD